MMFDWYVLLAAGLIALGYVVGTLFPLHLLRDYARGLDPTEPWRLCIREALQAPRNVPDLQLISVFAQRMAELEALEDLRARAHAVLLAAQHCEVPPPLAQALDRLSASVPPRSERTVP